MRPGLATINAARHAQLVRRVHAAAGWLKLDDEVYRDAIASHAGGKRSSKACSVDELETLLEHFHRIGYPRPGAKPDAKPDAKRTPLTATQKKLWALWQTLHAAGKVRDRSMKGLLAWIRGQTDNGVEALAFLTRAQEHTLIESLKMWVERDGK